MNKLSTFEYICKENIISISKITTFLQYGIIHNSQDIQYLRYLIVAKRIKNIIQAVTQLSDSVTKYLRLSIYQSQFIILAIISEVLNQGHMALLILNSSEAVHIKEHARVKTADLVVTKKQRQKGEGIRVPIFPLVAYSLVT